MPTLEWIGKEKVVNHHFLLPATKQVLGWLPSHEERPRMDL